MKSFMASVANMKIVPSIKANSKTAFLMAKECATAMENTVMDVLKMEI